MKSSSCHTALSIIRYSVTLPVKIHGSAPKVWCIGDEYDVYSISIDSVYYSETALHLSITTHTHNGACTIKTMARHDQNFHEY